MANIRLAELTLKNFGIFKDETIDFRNKDIIGILAEYASDPTRSNRAGKTLFIEAIRYLLTGLTRKKKPASYYIHHGEKVMEVKGVFEDDNGRLYNLRRGVDHKRNGVLEVDWTEKTRDGQKAIEELFGVTKDDFDLTSFFKQSDINGFMDLSPTEKTQFLMKWMDNEHWKKKHEAVMEDIKVYSEKLRENEAVKKALESSLEIDSDLKVLVEDLEEKNRKLEKKEKGLTEVYHKLSGELKEIIAVKKGAKDKIHNLQIVNEEIEDLIEKEATWKGTIKTNEKDIKELISNKKKLRSSLESVTKRATELNIDLKNRDQTLIKMTNSDNGMCPVLNETCDRIKFSKKDITDFKKESSEIKTRLAKLLADVKMHKHNEEIDYKVDSKKVIIDKLQDRLKHLAINDTRDKNNKEITKLKKSLNIDLVEKETELSKVDDEIIDITDRIKNNLTEIGGLNQRAKKAQEALEKIDDVANKNEKLKSRISDLKYIAGMFGKNGIPADEIENAFIEVQDDINYILKELDCGLTVSFSPDKELTKWEPICHCGFRYPKGFRGSTCNECDAPRLKQRKDEISLTILENGIESDFEMDSGGGTTIISYAVRIALTMLKRRQNKCNLNILFLDEVDSALDSHLAATITDSITKILTKRLGYDQIFMISHKDEIKNSVPHILKVIRHDTHSTISLAS